MGVLERGEGEQHGGVQIWKVEGVRGTRGHGKRAGQTCEKVEEVRRWRG